MNKKTLILMIGLIVLFLIFNLFFSGTNKKEQPLNTQKPEQGNNQLLEAKETDKYELIKNLSIEQKIGQLFMVGFDGKTLTPEIEKSIREIRPGAVLLLKRNIGTDAELKNLISSLKELSKNDSGLPLFIAVDQEGMDLNRIEDKEDVSQSKIESEKQARELGEKKAEKLKSFGINLNLAPLLDNCVKTDFIYYRTFKKLPETAGAYARALVEGQKAGGIFSCIKHFPGYVGISFNPEEKLASGKSFPVYSQFNTAMNASPEMVMVSNVTYNDLDSENPLTFSKKGIDYVKEKLGNNFIILSDDLDQNAVLKNYSLEDIVSKPINAGVDMIIFSGWRKPSLDGFNALKKALSGGKINEKKLNEAVLKIVKFKKENFDRF